MRPCFYCMHKNDLKLVIFYIIINCHCSQHGWLLLSSYLTQGWVKRWGVIKLQIARVPVIHTCSTITGSDEMKWMRQVWRNGGMKFVAGENRRNPNLTRLNFVYHETQMESPRCKVQACNPSCGKWVTDHLHHRAALWLITDSFYHSCPFQNWGALDLERSPLSFTKGRYLCVWN